MKGVFGRSLRIRVDILLLGKLFRRTYRQQHFHRERANWLAIDHGLFRLRDYPNAPHEDLIRWSMWSRDQKGNIKAVVSHESALAFHELGEVMPAKLHITVSNNFRKQAPDACVLHYNDLPKEDIESYEGFLVTTPLRTIKLKFLRVRSSPRGRSIVYSVGY
jgi:predicted transcriptional regulator of viral defense system